MIHYFLIVCMIFGIFPALQASFCHDQKSSYSPTQIDGLITPSPRQTTLTPTLERLARDYDRNIAEHDHKIKIEQERKVEQERKFLIAKKSLFWAIEGGYDSQICHQLWQKVQEHISNPFDIEPLEDNLKEYCLEKSPKIVNLKKEINRGRTNATKRQALQAELPLLELSLTSWLKQSPDKKSKK
jgi:hypothetical protein